jgi:hypothetical protein
MIVEMPDSSKIDRRNTINRPNLGIVLRVEHVIQSGNDVARLGCPARRWSGLDTNFDARPGSSNPSS